MKVKITRPDGTTETVEFKGDIEIRDSEGTTLYIQRSGPPAAYEVNDRGFCGLATNIELEFRLLLAGLPIEEV